MYKRMVYFPPEIMNFIFEFHNPYWGIKDKMNKLHEYLDKENLKLSRGGIFTKDTKYYFDTDPMKDPLTANDYKNIAKCVSEIPNIFVPRKTLSISSYGGKHRVEQYRKQHHPKEDNYISNGAFITAMLLHGHKMLKQKGNGNPNCKFYVSLKKK